MLAAGVGGSGGNAKIVSERAATAQAVEETMNSTAVRVVIGQTGNVKCGRFKCDGVERNRPLSWKIPLTDK